MTVEDGENVSRSDEIRTESIDGDVRRCELEELVASLESRVVLLEEKLAKAVNGSGGDSRRQLDDELGSEQERQELVMARQDENVRLEEVKKVASKEFVEVGAGIGVSLKSRRDVLASMSSEKDWEVPRSSDPTIHRGGRFSGMASRKGLFVIDEASSDKPVELPESVYILMFTESVLSLPFVFACGIAAIPILIMILVIISYVRVGTQGNPFNIPSGVPGDVRVAQFLGIFVGVLMEQETAQGIALIGLGTKSCLQVNGKDIGRRQYIRFVLSSICRLVIGYLFLLNLMLVTASSSSVLEIFYNILAIEFVQNIDDVAFYLAKNGMFGNKLLRATTKEYSLSVRDNHHQQQHPRSISQRCKIHPLKSIYILNTLALIAGMVTVAVKQNQGEYRCNSVTVSFGDALWEEAIVHQQQNKRGLETNVLFYSYFNGVYKVTGTKDGYPVYTEQNKENGSPYLETIGAEFRYCLTIGAWVFTHPNIQKSIEQQQSDSDDNECSWLLRSAKTQLYDLSEAVSVEWTVWVGKVETGAVLSADCNECQQISDCNYRGTCANKVCTCDSGNFGLHCEFDPPCEVLLTEKVIGTSSTDNTTLSLINRHSSTNGNPFVTSYGRPIYVAENLSGKPYDLLRLEIAGDNDFLNFNLWFHSEEEVNQSDNSNARSLTNDLSTRQLNRDYFDNDDFFYIDEFIESNNRLSNYSVVVAHTGRRWYGTIQSSNGNVLDEYNAEYHAFWNKTFSRNTFIISAPSTEGTPIGVDFFEMRRRNKRYDDLYGPFGVLLRLIDVEGAGFFRCNETAFDYDDDLLSYFSRYYDDLFSYDTDEEQIVQDGDSQP